MLSWNALYALSLSRANLFLDSFDMPRILCSLQWNATVVHYEKHADGHIRPAMLMSYHRIQGITDVHRGDSI